jgi:MEMO1 family protein
VGFRAALTYNSCMRIELTSAGDRVRRPAVAGSFYPGDRETLTRELAQMLEQTAEAAPAPAFPKIVIVPHAGYIYSGPVAASAYDRLRPARGIVTRVVLLGPAHRVSVRGLALPGAAAFDTPLGRITIDAEAAAQIRDLPQVAESREAHALEHSLEVQLPFLQRVLGDFALVPLVVGEATAEEVAQVIERLWGGPETLIVISSDLSHYLPYDAARRADGITAKAILGFDTGISHEQACGATPVAGALIVARQHGLTPQLLDLRNSGDTAGGKAQVVGYASFAFSAGDAQFGPEHGRALLALARASIGSALGANPAPAVPDVLWLKIARATFVTLKKGGDLRGCIGSLEARRPLGEDVIANARAAAFQDPRFPPLSRQGFDAQGSESIGIEVSLLSAPRRILFQDHADLIRQLRPGADGIILEYESLRATFLPQVWEGLPDPEQFLAHLKLKAEIPANVPTTRCTVLRYGALKWSETQYGGGT